MSDQAPIRRDHDTGQGDSPRTLVRPEHVRSMRLGHGANCSSVGSVIDTLFLGAAAAGAIFAAVCAAMSDEPIRIVGGESDADERGDDGKKNDPEPTEESSP